MPGPRADGREGKLRGHTSQMIRGACEVLADRRSLDAEAFAAGLEGARERSYASVREPVEGTMLTVTRMRPWPPARPPKEEADLPRGRGGEAGCPRFGAPHPGAARCLAGGRRRRCRWVGCRRGPRRRLRLRCGQEIEVPEAGDDDAPDLEAIHAQEEAWGYCTEFLVAGFDGDVEEFKERVYASGRSVFVVDQDDVVKVHVHAGSRRGPLLRGSFGRLAGVKIDDMEAQVRSREPEGRSAARLGVVAASRGDGNRTLRADGGRRDRGRSGENPSAADLAGAVEEIGARAVVLLPNNKNIVPTAAQVGELVEAKTYGCRRRTHAGLAVMVGYGQGEPDEVIEEMREISDSLRVAELTRSMRDARVGEREVPKGLT